MNPEEKSSCPGTMVRLATSQTRVALGQVLNIFEEEDRPDRSYCSIRVEDLEQRLRDGDLEDSSRYAVVLEVDASELYFNAEEINQKYGARLKAAGVDGIVVLSPLEIEFT